MEQVATNTIIRNGINVTDLMATIEAVQKDPSLANFRFRADNQWLGGGQNRS